ncbi:MAG: PhoH-like ATPase [Patescibacteria group bacterium]|nr:PhoH-like ATPase [Patescibacteria group bacterium]
MKKVKNSVPVVNKNGLSQEEEKGNVIIVDTNVFINDYTVLHDFIKDKNLLIVPKTVVVELDKLKTKPEVKHEARMASNLIYKFHKEGKLKILWSQNFSRLSLDKDVPDNQIIACLNHVTKSTDFSSYKKIKLVTDDTSMLILASSFFENNPRVEVERFRNIRIPSAKTEEKGLKIVKLNLKDYDKSGKIIYKANKFPGIKENDGVLLKENDNLSLAYRKKNEIVRIPSYISASGIKSQNEGERNWEQELLIAQLLDPEIKVVMASGGAGSGKTLLALAAALEKHDDYRDIILTRPAILIGDLDRLGFLPGDLNAKMSEFMDPFVQNLEVIIDANDKNPNFWMKEVISEDSRKKNCSRAELLNFLRTKQFEFLSRLGIKVNSIQYYKGRTYHKTFLIVDEAQDLSPIEIKQIITRMGRDSKVVFVGDLGQIDRRFLNAENSGLSYAMAKMVGNPMIGVVNLTHTVRSEVAAYAEKVL